MRRDERGKGLLRRFRNNHIDVMSYDRLVETCQNQSDWLVRQSQGIDELRTSLPGTPDRPA